MVISVKKEVKQKKNKKNINKNKKTKYEEIKNKVKDFILKYYYILIISLPFILIDIITKILGYKIHFYGIFRLVPCLFTLTYIILMVGISLFLEKKKGKIVYTIFFILAFALFITNNIYYSMTNTFFDFSLIMLAGEGSDYFMDAILNCNIWVYISSVVIIISYIFGLKQFKERKKTDLKKIIKVFFLFLIPYAYLYLKSAVVSGQTSPACGIPMYYVQAAPLVSFVLVAFRVLQRWIIEFRVARGENVFDPAHPERNTPESFIQANAESLGENALESGIDNRINTIKNSNEEER